MLDELLKKVATDLDDIGFFVTVWVSFGTVLNLGLVKIQNACINSEVDGEFLFICCYRL